MGSKVTVVVGAQFGSEGKGAICGHLGYSMGARDVAIRVAGPNAGHTVIHRPSDTEVKLRCLPVAAVTSPDCQLHIAAGSEIDMEVLFDEIAMVRRATGIDPTPRLSIHPSATILRPKHQEVEAAVGLTSLIGSTGKGIGAARADRIMRQADTVESIQQLAYFIGDPGPFDLFDRGDVVIEGTQGYGLGLHTTNYPQVTSSDCRAIDFLAMAGISPWAPQITQLEVILVARVYPIRVAGNSGPLHGETTWAELGLPEERTTVTNNVRRVGKWDQELVEEAIQANGGGNFHPNVTLALTMLDHRFPDAYGMGELEDAQIEWVEELGDSLGIHVAYVGTGPDTVVEL